MDWLTFFSKAIDALAWPVVVGFVLYSIKDQLIALVPSLKSLEAGPLKAEFAEQAVKVEAKVEEINDDFNKKLGEAGATESIEKATTSVTVEALGLEGNDTAHEALFSWNSMKTKNAGRPSALVLESWRDLEFVVRRLASLKGFNRQPDAETVTLDKRINYLEANRVLDGRTASAIYDLRTMRDVIAHTDGFEPSETAALSFVNSVRRIMRPIRVAIEEAKAVQQAAKS